MSVQALSWVLDHSEAKHGERLVLIAIANHYDFNDPALVVLAREARLSRSAVIRAIQNLEVAGELAVERDPMGGRSRKNHYLIPGYEGSRFATVNSGERVASARETVANRRRNGSAHATRTIGNHLEPSRGALADEIEPCPVGTCDGTGWIDVADKREARRCGCQEAA